MSAAQILAKTSIFELTETQKLELIELYATDKANYQNIESIQALAASQAATTGVTNTLSLSFKGLGVELKKLWGMLIGTPLGQLALAGAAIAAVVTVTDALTTSLEEQQEKLEITKQECSDIQSELKSLNDESKTTESRINELKGKGIDNLTFAEKEEYDNLVKTNNELQRRIDLLELQEKVKSKEKNKEFVNTASKDSDTINNHQEHFDNLNEYRKALEELDSKYKNDQDNLHYQNTKKGIQKNIDDLILFLNNENNRYQSYASDISYIPEPTTDEDKAVNEWLDKIHDFQDKIAIELGGTNAKTNAFNRLIDNWQFDGTIQKLQDLGEQGKVTADILRSPVYTDFINKLTELGVIDYSWQLDEVANAFNSLADTVESVSLSEAAALVMQEEASTEAQHSLTQLYLSKSYLNSITIDTSSDIANLIALARAAKISNETIQALENNEARFAAIENSNLPEHIKKQKLKEIEDSLLSIDFESKFSNAADLLTDTVKGTQTFSSAQDKLSDSASKANDALQEQKDALEKEKQALEDTRSELEELHEAVNWHYDNKISKIDEAIEIINKETEALQKQQDTYDNALDAVDRVYQTEIDRLEEKKNAIDETNDAEEKTLALEKAKKALEDAKRSRTIMQYREGIGFEYVSDTAAIKEAEDELQTLEDEAVKDKLQEQIDLLEEYRQKWAEIPDHFNDAMNDIAASAVWGENWKIDVLDPSDEMLRSFLGQYAGIQQGISDNENRISALEYQKEQIEKLKELWEDAKNAYRDSQYEMKLESFFGSDYDNQLMNNAAAWREQFAEEYADICAQIETVEQKLKALTSDGSGTAQPVQWKTNISRGIDLSAYSSASKSICAYPMTEDDPLLQYLDTSGYLDNFYVSGLNTDGYKNINYNIANNADTTIINVDKLVAPNLHDSMKLDNLIKELQQLPAAALQYAYKW